MTPDQKQPYIAYCPWCGPGTSLVLRSDGIGGQALWCQQCMAKGPTVAMSGDFEQMDQAAISRWSERPTRLRRDVLERVERSIQIDAMMAFGSEHEDRPIHIRRTDLLHMVSAAIG